MRWRFDPLSCQDSSWSSLSPEKLYSLHSRQKSGISWERKFMLQLVLLLFCDIVDVSFQFRITIKAYVILCYILLCTAGKRFYLWSRQDLLLTFFLFRVTWCKLIGWTLIRVFIIIGPYRLLVYVWNVYFYVQ